MVDELDPDKREWEYDGDGSKIYKLEAGNPTKTPYIEWKKLEPYSVPIRETDLDGGVPWIKQSDIASIKMNGD